MVLKGEDEEEEEEEEVLVVVGHMVIADYIKGYVCSTCTRIMYYCAINNHMNGWELLI